jgi:hypothetical protein
MTSTRDDRRPEDFHVKTGEYDPGWQQREIDNTPFDGQVLNMMGEELKRHVMDSYDHRTQDIISVSVPRWFFKAWAAIVENRGGPDAPITFLGKPMYPNDSGLFALEAGPLS